MYNKKQTASSGEFTIPLDVREKPYKITFEGFIAKLKKSSKSNPTVAAKRELIAAVCGMTSPDAIIDSDEMVAKVITEGKKHGLTPFELLWEAVVCKSEEGMEFKTGVPKGITQPDTKNVLVEATTFKGIRDGKEVDIDAKKITVMNEVAENEVNNANLPEVEEIVADEVK